MFTPYSVGYAYLDEVLDAGLTPCDGYNAGGFDVSPNQLGAFYAQTENPQGSALFLPNMDLDLTGVNSDFGWGLIDETRVLLRSDTMRESCAGKFYAVDLWRWWIENGVAQSINAQTGFSVFPITGEQELGINNIFRQNMFCQGEAVLPSQQSLISTMEGPSLH